MKRFFFLTLISTLFLLVGCKKDAVDGSSTKAFQESINDMSSSLPTIKQIKFSEALYILKTFGVEADGDIAELKALAKLLEGKKVPEIFAMADKVAQENGVNWASNAPPSLGEMNIFQNITPSETDPNDIVANAIQLNINQTSIDSVLGAKAIVIIPRLVDASGKKISFDNAALETTLEVSNQGEKLLTSKNLMQNNNFKGFVLKFASLPKDKILDDKIDIKVTVRTSKKTLQMSRLGVSVNPNALLQPEATTGEATDVNAENPTDENATGPDAPKITGDPKNTVVSFLNNLNSQNLKGAYSQAENPSWSSYETFSNPTSGFGTVKSVSVSNVSTKSNANNTANVNATYTVTDKSGNSTDLDVSYGLKATESGWKITSYKINSSKKK
jgi:hypothetical protein